MTHTYRIGCAIGKSIRFGNEEKRTQSGHNHANLAERNAWRHISPEFRLEKEGYPPVVAEGRGTDARSQTLIQAG